MAEIKVFEKQAWLSDSRYNHVLRTQVERFFQAKGTFNRTSRVQATTVFVYFSICLNTMT